MLDFLMERDRIARELCVQRDVQESHRTCHGQCHLVKQLKEAEGREQQRETPPPTIRYEVQFVEERAAMHFVPALSKTLGFGISDPAATCDGFVSCPEGVPWT